MISDRYYMRANNPARELAPLLWLIGALVGTFIVQQILDRIAPTFTARWLALTPDNILHGKVWTLVTYSFLHSTTTLWHLIGNALGILFIGRMLLPVVGARRLIWTYGMAVVAGGILWLAANFFHGNHPLIGASGGVYGLFALFCCRFAYERITLLLFFILPITVVPRYLLMISGAITALFFVFDEVLPPVGMGSGIAHSAHLAGMIVGIIAHRMITRLERQPEEEPAPRRAVELPAWMRKRKDAEAPTEPAFKVNITARENLKAEVDRILDKINTSGFGSLTPEEKRTLDAARNLMSK